MRHVVDNTYRELSPAREGAVITRWVADELHLHRGDPITLEIRENQRRLITVRLIDTVDEPLFNSVYVELGALGRLLGEPETYSAANLAIDMSRESELYAEVKRLPAAASVDMRRAALANYSKMSDPATDFIREIELVFAVIIAFGVVYNTARIALAERGRELATLRVLGFTRGEVSRILLGEVGALAIPAIPLGLAVGYLLTGVVARAMSGERMHVPLVVSAASYTLAAVVFVAAATASALVVRRGLDRLDLIGTLKARE
jgi:putative ABC transport system permease protein